MRNFEELGMKRAVILHPPIKQTKNEGKKMMSDANMTLPEYLRYLVYFNVRLQDAFCNQSRVMMTTFFDGQELRPSSWKKIFTLVRVQRGYIHQSSYLIMSGVL